MEFILIGFVHSGILSRSDMSVQGVDAEIGVFPDAGRPSPALRRIRTRSSSAGCTRRAGES
ncbi:MULTISPECIES: hypothetical protein [unclassified Methanoculleus]|jgi:hypothetical protein|uniref:hypothetical protein n=1 Tax=unclassified Methanoculleus TaxID=2619537 RepID=UPI00316AC365